MIHRESDLQSACVYWFRLAYPKLAAILFSVPNGGHRNKMTAVSMKREGQTAGVADLILLRPNSKYASLCIEMKADTGRQTEKQRDWQRVAEENHNKYVVCRSFDEFKLEIENYLGGL